MQKNIYSEAAKHGFKQQDVDQLLKFSSIMSSKVMKNFLLESVDDAASTFGLNEYKRANEVPNEKSELYACWKRVRANINKIKADDFTGYQELPFAVDGENYIVRMQLSKVPSSYQLEIRLPENMIREFFTHMDNLIGVAMQYYHVVAEAIIADLSILFPNDDVSSLGINKNNRTLCLSETSKNRIGVLCFFVDKNGKPLELC